MDPSVVRLAPGGTVVLLRDAERELDRAYLSRLFRESRGDLEAMAKALGIKVSNVYHWLKRVGLDIRSLRQDS